MDNTTLIIVVLPCAIVPVLIVVTSIIKLKTLITGILFVVFFNASGQNYSQIVDSLFEHSSGEIAPGFSIAIIKDDTVICQQSYGYATIKHKIKLDERTNLAIASCSKQFTAYCILLLEQEGKLHLTDDIRKYIPELPDYFSTITIKHLLSHTSGIRDHIVMLGWESKQKEKYYDFEGTLEALKKFNGLSFVAGEDFAYSNTGYVLLALIVEKVSGLKFHTFTTKHIFEPLGMSNTHFSFRRELEVTNPYRYNLKKEKFNEFTHKEVNALGATGIYTTIADFILWDKYLSNPPTDKVSLLDKMFSSDTLNNGQSVNYNFGFKHRKFKGYQIVEHSGGWANYNFQYTRIPELDISIVIGSNNGYYYPIGMAEKLLEKIIPDDRIMSHNVSTLINLPDSFQNQFVCKDFSSCRITYTNDKYIITGKSLYGAKNYPIQTTEDGIVTDSSGNNILFNPTDTSFIWFGGAYFNTPRLFEVNSPIDSNSLFEYTGVFYSHELGKLKVKYNKNAGNFKLKTSFGTNPRVLSYENRLIKTNKDYDIILLNENSLLLGNWLVRVKFEKKR